MRRWVAQTVWAALYLITMLMPVALSWAVPGDDAMDRAAVESGLLAASALACAVVLPSRLRSLTSSFGIEDVLGSHRWLGGFVAVAVAAHLAVVLVSDPANLARLDLVHAPLSGRAGTLAILALLVLVLRALRPRPQWERWRTGHVLLAALVLALTGLHVWALRDMIEHPVARVWFVVLALGLLGVAVYRWVWRRFVPGEPYRVRELHWESYDVVTLVLEPRNRRRYVLDFNPGQFVWLRLKPSLRAEQHPYTISSSAIRSTSLSFTVRELGDFSSQLARLQPGDPIWLDGPHGAFSLDHMPTTGLVLIAGGVGITPMISMLRTLADRGDERPHRLIAVARTPYDLLFSDELVKLRERLNLEVIGLVRRPDGDEIPGDIDEELLVRMLPGPFRRQQLTYFVAGSTAMVTAVLNVLRALEIPRCQIHTERFDLP
jgi:predicted ferric reductase